MGFEEVRRASKGCPMTITPPSRSWRLDAMGAPGWGSICRGEANAFEAKAVDQARGTSVRARPCEVVEVFDEAFEDVRSLRRACLKVLRDS